MLDRCRKDFVAEENDSEESKNNNSEHNLNRSYIPDVYYSGRNFVAGDISYHEESENNNSEHNLSQSHGAYGYERILTE